MFLGKSFQDVFPCSATTEKVGSERSNDTTWFCLLVLSGVIMFDSKRKSIGFNRYGDSAATVSFMGFPAVARWGSKVSMLMLYENEPSKH